MGITGAEENNDKKQATQQRKLSELDRELPVAAA